MADTRTRRGPYRLAIIGCGRVAHKHAKAIKNLPGAFQLSALVDRNREAMDALNREQSLGLPSDVFFSSIEELYKWNATLGDRALDLVAITTPSGSHYSLAKDALSHGLHVFLEKPMTLDLGQARELEALAREKGLKIAMGHIYRFFPLVDLIQDDIARGLYGQVLSAEVKVHWGHDQAYYDLAAWRGTWKADGGALMNQTIHALDLMVWLLSLNPIACQGAISQRLHQMEAEDYGAALFTLENGAILSVEGTTVTPESDQSASFRIVLEKATVEAGLRRKKPYFNIKDRAGKSVGHYKSRLWKQMRQKGFAKSIRSFTNPHMGIYDDLARSLDKGPAQEPLAGARSGVQAVENILAIYASALQGGKKIHLPLDDFSLEEMEGFFD